jgi:hypothetical protein
MKIKRIIDLSQPISDREVTNPAFPATEVNLFNSSIKGSVSATQSAHFPFIPVPLVFQSHF